LYVICGGVNLNLSDNYPENYRSEEITFHTLHVRDTQRGMLAIKFAAVRVLINSEHSPVPRECWLLIRKELDGSGIKFTLSNSLTLRGDAEMKKVG